MVLQRLGKVERVDFNNFNFHLNAVLAQFFVV